MGKPENNTPGDDQFWAYLDDLAKNSLEDSTGCKRVHPVVEKWLQNAFQQNTNLDAETKQKFISELERLRDSSGAAMHSPSVSEVLDFLARRSLVAGRKLILQAS